jgi:hypothetical protein
MAHYGIDAWLSEIWREQLQALFAEQQIALADLPDLSEQDLEKLGIPLGPRKRLIKAIAALSSSTAPTQPEKSTEPVSARAGPDGELHRSRWAGAPRRHARMWRFRGPRCMLRPSCP